jgi:lipoate-protein ligase A
VATVSAARFVSDHSSYRLVRSSSTAADFHARTVPEPATCEIWHHEITSPALVLGSTQDESVVDADACGRAGVDVVRRRSGGGAVLLLPDDVTWIDVIVPTGAVGWSTDVHGPMRWLGGHLAVIVDELAGSRAAVDVHDGAMAVTPWSPLICFDGIGVGEVLLGGHKLMGISQRRTRHAARLQCCWYSAYDPARLVELLDASRRPALDELAPVATLAPATASAIVDALADRLA